MKHPTINSRFIIIIVAIFKTVTSQDCPFTTGLNPIDLEGEDIDNGTIPLFSSETALVILDARIESGDNVPPPGSLLTATSNSSFVNIFAKHPKFGVELDYYGYEEGYSSGSSNGLLIFVEGESQPRVCNLHLVIHDTNNLAPYFNTSNDKEDFEFTVTTAWNKKDVAFNWKPDDWIYVTDWDRTMVVPTLEVEMVRGSDVNITGVLTTVEMSGEHEHANVWRVELFVYGDLTENQYEFKITASDGVNRGLPLNAVLNVEEENLFEPVCTNEVYYKQLDKMPQVGDPLDVAVKCYDPDDLLNGRNTEFDYKLTSDEGVEEYLEFDADNNLRFIKDVPRTFSGKTVKATITATKTGGGDTASSQLELTFPLPSKITFPTHIHVVPLPTWPKAAETIDIPEAIGERITYALGTSKPPPNNVISLDKVGIQDVIKFVRDVRPDMLGDLEEHRVLIFDIVVTYPDIQGHVELDDVITIVLTFPRWDDGTTENPTTVQECETCEACPTTGNPTTDLTTECSCGTDITEITCPTELPTTPCDCDSTTPPDFMTTPECPPPTTCEPCGVTGNPTEYGSTEGCPVCVTTEASDVTCGTVDPTSGGTSDPCDCSTEVTCPTQEPCEGSSSEVPCSTPEPCDCSTTTENPTTGHSCETREPCDCGTLPTTCPTVEPCECEGASTCAPLEDCSTTGLVVAVITTSVLCACSIVAGGYCLWLLRKATLDPTKLVRDSIFRPDMPSTQSPPPTDLEVNAGDDYTTPHRFSFGDGTNEYSSGSRFAVPPTGTEPGFANPNFTNDNGVVDPPVNAPETKQRRKSSIKPPKDIEPDYEESPKKSNMKTPKEIEPDYEELVSPSEPVADSGKQSRVLFAPEDEYISVDGGSNDVVGGGGSDVEDERL